MWWFAGIAAVALVLMALVLQVIKRRQYRADVLMERMRTSALYSRLLPVLERCRNCCIEQIGIHANEVRIVLYRPKSSFSFSFDRYGLDPIDQPQTLEALAKAVAVDLPVLNDGSKYYFRVHTEPRDGGGSFHWYEYTVQIGYKDQMLRAWYDHGQNDGLVS